jgi:diguanylate cyclase (GGDEF)-like protein
VRILVAEDDAASLMMVRMAVQRLGHECETAADGAQAWDAFNAGHPDVVISDWMMPGQSGVELCRRIRADPHGANIYVILLTSRGANDQILAGMHAGADDYLIKPLDLDELERRLVAATRVTSRHGRLADQRAQLESRNHELAALARHDALTGLRNRRVLDEDLEMLEARVARYGHSYCMALLDIDHFKTYNDTYGHQAGDDVLRAVGAQLEREARAGDALYRYGGEEFLCILPEQSLAFGVRAAERMRAAVQHLKIPHRYNGTGVVTLSGGVATLNFDDARPCHEVLKEADDALYRAKEHGRNRIEGIAPMTHAADSASTGTTEPDQEDRTDAAGCAR